jgi:hypothetical protein
MELFFPKNGYGTHHIQKINVILSKCDTVIENIQIHVISLLYFILFYFKFFPVKFFAQMWKINMKRKYLISFFLDSPK